MIEDEIERINKAITKREKAINKGDEAKAKEIEDLLEEQGFEVKDKDDVTYVSRKEKSKGTI